MATHSSIPAWRIPWTGEPVGYSPQGLKESDMTEATAYRHGKEICLGNSGPEEGPAMEGMLAPANILRGSTSKTS